MQALASEVFYAGESLQLHSLDDGFVELRFDRRDGAVNMFDQRTVAELDAARQRLEQLPGLRGILVTSAKDVFIVGADITEFTATFAQSRPQLLEYLRRSNEVFLRFEALDLPSVAAINGFALGGGLEFALVATHRVMAQGARIGVPEVGLGLIPGFGGTVRLPRVAGVAHGLDWITDGEPRDADAALRCGVVDRVCAANELREQALLLLRSASADWRERRLAKLQPVAMADEALVGLIDQRRAAIARNVPPYLPAAAEAIELVARSARIPSAAAQVAEAETFATLAHSESAVALVRNFINQQAVRRLARQMARAPQDAAAAQAGVPIVPFLSPLPGATLAEIAAGPLDNPACVARAAAAAAAGGRIALRVKEVPGGLVRRVHAACMHACQALLQRGSTPDEIDAAMRRAGWAVGPFAADALLHPGREAALGPRLRGDDEVDIVERLLLAITLEAARVLDEGVVGSAAEIDFGLQMGLGFPRHLGGPLHHADRLGLAKVCARAQRAGLDVPAALREKAARDERFYAAA